MEGDELLPQRPIESFDKMLEGQVAGVQVELNTGEPGLPVQVRIRGNASIPPVRSSDIVASGQPLFVLGGQWIAPMVRLATKVISTGTS